MTAAMHTRQLPLDWLMRQGVHTSEFMWLNIKDRSWDERFNEDLSFATGAAAKKKRKTSAKAPVWNRMSDMTIQGMTVLSLLCSLCRPRASPAPTPQTSSIHIEGVKAKVSAPIAPPPAMLYVYVKPHKLQFATEEEESARPAVDNGWRLQIVAFTDTLKKGTAKNAKLLLLRLRWQRPPQGQRWQKRSNRGPNRRWPSRRSNRRSNRRWSSRRSSNSRNIRWHNRRRWMRWM